MLLAQKYLFKLLLVVSLQLPSALWENCAAEDYRTAFTFDYTWAVNFVRTNKTMFDSVSSQYKTNPAAIAAVVFPELIRFSMVRNYFETSALNLLYVKYGSMEVDFSIGYFQIKPSFAEKLEDSIRCDTILRTKYSSLWNYATATPRQERVNRLNSLEWSLIYLNAYFDWMVTRIPAELTKDQKIKLRYIATAYNCGFTLPAETIQRWMERKTFPYGPRSDARQYNYSSISLYYFEKATR